MRRDSGPPKRTRRHLLRGAGLGLGGFFAGCVGGRGGGGASGGGDPDGTDGTPNSGDGISTHTRTELDAEAYVYNGGPELPYLDAAQFPQRRVSSYYVALLTETEHAERLSAAWEGDEEAETFAADTDFDSSALVVMQNRSSSSHPDYEVATAERMGGGVSLMLRRPGNATTSDIITENVLVRVPKGDPEPRFATVRLDEGAGTTFSTEGKFDRSALENPVDLVYRNRDCEEHRLVVDATIDDELVLSRQLTLSSGGVRVVRAALTEAATYSVRTRDVSGGSETTAGVELDGSDDPAAVVTEITGDGSFVQSTPDETPDFGPAECEASSLPYESSDPSENVASPVGLRYVSLAETSELDLRVVVRDGDRTVVDRTVTLSGKTKADLTDGGLIAKKGTYDLSVAADGEVVAEERWVVDEAGDDASVVVERDRRVQVAVPN